MMERILLMVWILTACRAASSSPQDTTHWSDKPEQRERPNSRHWSNNSPLAMKLLQQQQQNSPSVYLQTSTQKPVDNAAVGSAQHDNSIGGRHFEDPHKKTASAAPLDQDVFSRHYGYLNVHRFDPNFPYYDPHAYPRHQTAHLPRYGPGYRKDKYGHGYGYSCKQGDDCDEMKAANQITGGPLMPMPSSHYPSHATRFGGPYPELPPLPSIPAFASMPPAHYGQYTPARYSDPHMMPSYPPMPSRYYHGRYLHEQNETQAVKNETVLDQSM